MAREPRPAVGGGGARCKKRYNCNTSQRGNGPGTEQGGTVRLVVQPLPPKVSTIVDTKPSSRQLSKTAPVAKCHQLVTPLKRSGGGPSHNPTELVCRWTASGRKVTTIVATESQEGGATRPSRTDAAPTQSVHHGEHRTPIPGAGHGGASRKRSPRGDLRTQNPTERTKRPPKAAVQGGPPSQSVTCKLHSQAKLGWTKQRGLSNDGRRRSPKVNHG